MTGQRMNWDRFRLRGRPTFDHRREFEDATAKWLRRAESLRGNQRVVPRPRERRNFSTTAQSTDWITASSTGVPW
jgi:hypothetical protein